MIMAVVIAAAGLALAIAPFSRSVGNAAVVTSNPNVSPTQHCAAPIVSSWRHESFDGQWFGYAPLTGTTAFPLGPLCRPAARNRLALAFALWFAAGFVVLFRRRPRAIAPSVAPA